MRAVIDQHPRVVTAAEEAIRRAGVEPVRSIIRGGTDGAVLSAIGLPTPNIFTGGQNYHSLREWASVQDMAAAAATVVELVRVWAPEDAAMEERIAASSGACVLRRCARILKPGTCGSPRPLRSEGLGDRLSLSPGSPRSGAAASKAY